MLNTANVNLFQIFGDAPELTNDLSENCFQSVDLHESLNYTGKCKQLIMQDHTRVSRFNRMIKAHFFWLQQTIGHITMIIMWKLHCLFCTCFDCWTKNFVEQPYQLGKRFLLRFSSEFETQYKKIDKIINENYICALLISHIFEI